MNWQEIPIVLMGAGGVGRALLRQIVASRVVVAGRNQLHFRVVAVADSRRVVVAPAGLSDAQLQAIVAAKTAGEPLPQSEERDDPTVLLDRLLAAGVEPGILVDVTAEDGLEPLLDRALAAGFGVALANKKALAGPWAGAQAYFNQPRLRHESTVGGGQPVIATLRYLMDINDRPLELSGQLSGTLGFLCQQLDAGVPFSAAVAEARARGYTEPDPREDLGGKDVMRKVLILARMAGWPLEEADIDVESLVPAPLAGLSVAEFMEAIRAADAGMAERAAAAHQAGQVLRYVGRVTPQGGQVGLEAIPAGSPLANLKYISFKTALYEDEPLLISGKGAGVEMTAGGVLGDLIGLARERR